MSLIDGALTGLRMDLVEILTILGKLLCLMVSEIILWSSWLILVLWFTSFKGG